jgi:hypothetical protein
MGEALFYNLTLGRHLTFEELVEEIFNYMSLAPKAKYKITVGSDSMGSNNTQFVTAVSVLKIGNGGRYFWSKSEVEYCPTLRDRIYKEAVRSITFTQELKSRLKDRLGEDFFWGDKIDVHVDVGQAGKTKEFVESVIGMVKGYGFNAVIKPNSFTASILADRHT